VERLKVLVKASKGYVVEVGDGEGLGS